MIDIQQNLENKIRELEYSKIDFCNEFALNKIPFYSFLDGEMTADEEKLTHKVITYNYIYYTETVKDVIQEDRGFTISCNNCCSHDVEFKNEIDYDYDENPYVCGHNLRCKNCGQVEDV